MEKSYITKPTKQLKTTNTLRNQTAGHRQGEFFIAQQEKPWDMREKGPPWTPGELQTPVATLTSPLHTLTLGDIVLKGTSIFFPGILLSSKPLKIMGDMPGF